MRSIVKMIVIQFGCTKYRKVAKRDIAEQLCLTTIKRVSLLFVCWVVLES